jgi:hypothetical protein
MTTFFQEPWLPAACGLVSHPSSVNSMWDAFTSPGEPTLGNSSGGAFTRPVKALTASS